MTGERADIGLLEPLIGEWRLEASFPGVQPGRVVFEWMNGRRFIVERWEVPMPEAPDGLAVIGPDPEGAGFLQHYFDSRGVARIYRLTLEDGTLTLSRDTADFSPLDFRQRYVGTFSADGTAISGSWEICHDGTTWEHDFDLTYRRVVVGAA